MVVSGKGNGGRGGGAYSFVGCLSHLTIDHASLPRRSTVPTSNKRHLQQFGAHYVFFPMYYRDTFCFRILSPACFAVCGHHVSRRIAIFFVTLSSAPSFSVSHSSISFLTHPVSRCTFHILPLCKFYSIALPQGHVCASSSSSRLLAYFVCLFLLYGRSRSSTRNSIFSVFA